LDDEPLDLPEGGLTTPPEGLPSELAKGGKVVPRAGQLSADEVEAVDALLDRIRRDVVRSPDLARRMLASFAASARAAKHEDLARHMMMTATRLSPTFLRRARDLGKRRKQGTRPTWADPIDRDELRRRYSGG